MRDVTTSEDSQLFTDVFPREAQSAGPAREIVRRALEAWGLNEVTDTATLVVSELVTNAVHHAKGHSIRVTVTRVADTRVRVAVVDLASTSVLVTVDADEFEEHGRGLFLVEAMAAQWGVDRFRWGKRVWAEVEPEAAPESLNGAIPIWHTASAQAVYLAVLLIAMGALGYGAFAR
ncbi:ATP-binding protein [Streptomyces sp. BH106]|uniref:ATP-binding protein n=1 Tax=Streptomyces sp. BH106 TaxID=3410409 RepID=UPI003CEC94F8